MKHSAHTKKHSAHTKTFTLVLAGGGARGFAHAGVLRALEDEGYLPSAIVGVSMGAVVGVTYALRSDWYDALLAMKTDAFPAPFRTSTKTRRPVGEVIAGYARGSRIVWEMFFGWGLGERAVGKGRAALSELTGGRRLGEARIPVAVSATDLESGRRSAPPVGPCKSPYRSTRACATRHCAGTASGRRAQHRQHEQRE